jgi:cytochrome c oxidase cbb3-type subunit I/II
MNDPRSITARSIMPAYPKLLTDDIDFSVIQHRVDAMAMLGVPYGDALVAGAAPRMAREQARQIADGIAQQGGPTGLQDKEIVALTAYLQRLGRDISATRTAVAPPLGASPGGKP